MRHAKPAKSFTPTAAQKLAAAERRERMRNFASKVAKMTPEQRAALFQAHPVVTIEGKSLSIYNICFVLTQDERATVNQWRRAGRQVKKGEHGLAIWFPRAAKVDPEKQEGEISSDDLETKFMLGTVFDVAQTEEVAQ